MQLRRAKAEADRRWGEAGRVERERCRITSTGDCTGRATGAHPAGCPGGRTVCRVGRLNGVGGLSFFVIEGSGPTFAAAFARVDERRARDLAAYCSARKRHNRQRRCRLCKYRGPPGGEPLAEPQPDGTALTTDERLAAWQRAQAEAAARRAGARKLRAEAERLARAEDQRIPERAAAELARRGEAAKLRSGGTGE